MQIPHPYQRDHDRLSLTLRAQHRRAIRFEAGYDRRGPTPAEAVIQHVGDEEREGLGRDGGGAFPQCLPRTQVERKERRHVDKGEEVEREREGLASTFSRGETVEAAPLTSTGKPAMFETSNQTIVTGSHVSVPRHTCCSRRILRKCNSARSMSKKAPAIASYPTMPSRRRPFTCVQKSPFPDELFCDRARARLLCSHVMTRRVRSILAPCPFGNGPQAIPLEYADFL